MRIQEILEPLNEKQIWGRSGNRATRKYRCTRGPRRSKIVSSPEKCFASPDIAKSAQFKRTRKRLKSKIAKRSKKTKRINPASRLLKILNR